MALRQLLEVHLPATVRIGRLDRPSCQGGLRNRCLPQTKLTPDVLLEQYLDRFPNDRVQVLPKSLVDGLKLTVIASMAFLYLSDQLVFFYASTVIHADLRRSVKDRVVLSAPEIILQSMPGFARLSEMPEPSSATIRRAPHVLFEAFARQTFSKSSNISQKRSAPRSFVLLAVRLHFPATRKPSAGINCDWSCDSMIIATNYFFSQSLRLIFDRLAKAWCRILSLLRAKNWKNTTNTRYPPPPQSLFL